MAYFRPAASFACGGAEKSPPDLPTKAKLLLANQGET